MYSIKYPRTPHLPGSPAYSSDDELMIDLKHIYEENKNIVITEKMDGENTSLYRDGVHFRTINQSQKHPSRDWLRNYWSGFAHEIPEGYRICGENLYAQHSIAYEDLPSYFLAFNVWNEGVCLNWDKTLDFLSNLNIPTVPILYRGKFDWRIITNIANGLDLKKQEGFVLRMEGEFMYDDFSSYVAKWVRKNHVEEDKTHWFFSTVMKNKLAKS